MQKFTPNHVTHPDTNRGTIVFQRLSENDFDGLLGTEKQPKISDEEWVQYQLYFKEWLFQRRDAVSRRTGSLAKNIVLLDMGGLSQKHLGNKRYKKLMTSPAIKTADDMYPQALGTIVIINLPGALAWIFNKVPMRKPAHASHAPTRWHACEHPQKSQVVKPLAPPKVQDKIQVVASSSKAREAYAKLGIAPEHVPVDLGGNMPAWPPTPDARC